MRKNRLIAAGAVVALAGVGGMLALAPELHGQTRTPTRNQDGNTSRSRSSWEARLVASQDVRHLAGHDPQAILTLAHGGSRLGIRVRDVEASDVMKQELAAQAGAVIEEVQSGTPAARAGLKAGDVVTTFDAERVRSATQLDRLVNETPPGRTVKMWIGRDGAKLEVDITPDASPLAGAMPRSRGYDNDSFSFKRDLDTGRMNDDPLEGLRNKKFQRFAIPSLEFDWDGGDFPALSGRGRLGVSAEAVSGQLATYFGVESGVLIRDVADNSPASKAGIKAGDIITAVNGKDVQEAEDLRRQVAAATEDDAKEITLSVTREKKPFTLKATIDDPQKPLRSIRRVV